MTFLPNRDPSLWTADSQLLHTEAKVWDRDIPRAIDGFAGGTYAPSAPIIIGGSGLRVDGALDINGSSNFSGTNVFDGDTQFNADFASSHILDTPGGLSIGSFLGDGATFSGNVTVNGNTILGNASGDTITVNGTTTFASPLVFSDDAHIRYRRVDGVDANGQSYGVDTADTVSYAALGTSRTATITNTGAGRGARLRFVMEAGATTGSDHLTILAATGPANVQISASETGLPFWAEFEHDGTVWKRAIYGALIP